MGVVNHEYARINYSLQMDLNNSTFLKRDLSLEHNQTWEQPVSYAIHKIGNGQKLQFLLYKDGNFTAPYRDLHLWVNVMQSNSSVSLN